MDKITDTIFAQRLDGVEEKVHLACAKAGRNRNEICLIGVSKTKPWEDIQALHKAGLNDFGENYLQESVEKIALSKKSTPKIRWHFIGAIQSNKSRMIVENFDVVHSLCTLSSANKIQTALMSQKKTIECFVQVNIDDEPSKGGIPPLETKQFIQAIRSLPLLKLIGLMTVPSPQKDANESFKRLRELQNVLNKSYDGCLNSLSMGMSSDFEQAIANGATHIRIGTSLFGERK